MSNRTGGCIALAAEKIKCICAWATRNDIAVPKLDRVVAVAPENNIGRRARRPNSVIAGATVELVALGIRVSVRVNQIIADPTIYNILASAKNQGVVACAAVENVIASVTLQTIVTVSTIKPIARA